MLSRRDLAIWEPVIATLITRRFATNGGNHRRNQAFKTSHNDGEVGKMSKKILIVEDEFLVALNLRETLSALGFETLGIAPDAQTAYDLAKHKPDFALVDVNLRDGETGPHIGEKLAKEFGTIVLFVTANPTRLGKGIEGTVGVLCKPVEQFEVQNALDFLVKYKSGEVVTPPPSLRVFKNDNDFDLQRQPSHKSAR